MALSCNLIALITYIYVASELTHSLQQQYSRRSALLSPIFAGAGLVPTVSSAAQANGVQLTTAPSGFKYADAKVGTGAPIQTGSEVSIDYTMASVNGRFPQIYSTKDKGAPYRWTLGDGSTIPGIEKAIIGDEAEGIPPMRPGGVRRVIIPASLGYEAANKSKCGDAGPIPPNEEGAYQRWLQFYCNPRIPYQPDLVFDIKLYGKR